jgi:hypothetical protein
MSKIVGYTYRADVWCRACVASRFTLRGYHVHDSETTLDLAAQRAGIDRRDERSFDSGDFPKVIFSLSANDEGWEHCGECGDCIAHDKVDCTTECDHSWVAGMMVVHPEDLPATATTRTVECQHCGVTVDRTTSYDTIRQLMGWNKDE